MQKYGSGAIHLGFKLVVMCTIIQDGVVHHGVGWCNTFTTVGAWEEGAGWDRSAPRALHPPVTLHPLHHLGHSTSTSTSTST